MVAKAKELEEVRATAADRAERKRQEAERQAKAKAAEPPPVTAGPIDKVIDLAFNPSREKIREVTSIDRTQGRLLPQLDVINLMWSNVIEIATFRQDAVLYAELYKRDKPVHPNLYDEFMYRTAQWQKSVAGMNLKSAVDLALAETETRASEGEEPYSDRDFDKG